MIIYGTRSTHLNSTLLTEQTCSSCQQKEPILLSTFGSYAHIFWIPFSPIGKKVYSECQHCLHTMEMKEMPPDLNAKSKHFKTESTIPKWHFSGLAILAIVILVGTLNANQHKKLTKERIAAPVEFDIYEIKLDHKEYSTLKVVSVTSDSVFVLQNEMAINKQSRIFELDKPSNYVDTPTGFSRQDLLELYDTKFIIDVIRK